MNRNNTSSTEISANVGDAQAFFEKGKSSFLGEAGTLAENAAMTVVPFVLIVQLVMSGMMFSLPEKVEPIKELTISKWGLCAICSFADLNEIPTKDTLEKFEAAAESDEEITGWKDLGLTQKYDMDYDASVQNVTKIWLILIMYSAIYGTIGTISLKFVDKDKR